MPRATLSTSREKVTNNIAQTFSSDCNISCSNVIDGEQIKLKDGRKFQIERQCTLNGSCMMETTIGALANVEFAAPLSSNAEAAAKEGGIGFPGEDNPAVSRSRQELNTTIGQTAVDMCNTETTDQISKVEFLTGRQTFDGPVALVEDRTTKPACVLSKTLAAAASAADPGTSKKYTKGAPGATLLIAVIAILSGSVLSGIGISIYLKKNRV